ncbi:hypothetical protein GQ600_1756 [Phytophthora cactorum]|nr:hypothetical protein GQ600_1756 [Phytophthora cactorum]
MLLTAVPMSSTSKSTPRYSRRSRKISTSVIRNLGCQPLQRGAFKAYSLSPNNGHDSDSKQSLLEAKTLHVHKLDASLESFSGSLGIVVTSFCYSMEHKCEETQLRLSSLRL